MGGPHINAAIYEESLFEGDSYKIVIFLMFTNQSTCILKENLELILWYTGPTQLFDSPVVRQMKPPNEPIRRRGNSIWTVCVVSLVIVVLLFDQIWKLSSVEQLPCRTSGWTPTKQWHLHIILIYKPFW